MIMGIFKIPMNENKEAFLLYERRAEKGLINGK